MVKSLKVKFVRRIKIRHDINEINYSASRDFVESLEFPLLFPFTETSIQGYSGKKIYYDFMTNEARERRREIIWREKEKSLLCEKGREREREEGGSWERRNVDSIHRAQVEMVAHKYSYGIPEARKTFIPAEVYVCIR